MPLSRI